MLNWHDLRFELYFWKYMLKNNLKFWWRWRFLWFFQNAYYMLRFKSYRKLNRQMKEIRRAKSNP